MNRIAKLQEVGSIFLLGQPAKIKLTSIEGVAIDVEREGGVGDHSSRMSPLGGANFGITICVLGNPTAVGACLAPLYS